MEEVNQSSKLVAQSIDALKNELNKDLPDNAGSINEVIINLEKTLDLLSKII